MDGRTQPEFLDTWSDNPEEQLANGVEEWRSTCGAVMSL